MRYCLNTIALSAFDGCHWQCVRRVADNGNIKMQNWVSIFCKWSIAYSRGLTRLFFRALCRPARTQRLTVDSRPPCGGGESFRTMSVLETASFIARTRTRQLFNHGEYSSRRNFPVKQYEMLKLPSLKQSRFLDYSWILIHHRNNKFSMRLHCLSIVFWKSGKHLSHFLSKSLDIWKQHFNISLAARHFV